MTFPRRTLPLLLMMPAATALAGQCENNFKANGDPRNGAEYTTSVTLQDVTAGSALAQMRVITMGNKYKFLNQTGDERNGSIVVEYPRAMSYEAFPVTFTASSKGGATEVGVHTRASRGTNFKTEESRAHLCGLLAQIKGGKQGEALAASVRKAAGAGTSAVVDISPRKLSFEIEKQLRTSLRGPGASPQIITERYRGRRYRIDGQVYTKETETYGPRPNSHGKRISFDILKKDSLLGAGDFDTDVMTRTAIICEMAPGHEAFFEGLSEQDYLTLVGTFRVFEKGEFIITDCKPAK